MTVDKPAKRVNKQRARQRSDHKVSSTKSPTTGRNHVRGTKRPSCPEVKLSAQAEKSTVAVDDEDKRKAIKKTMNDLLCRLTKAESTICPSQIPRSLHDSDRVTYPDWRGMMDQVRDVVWDQVREGRVQVTQGGVVRSLEEREGLKGPIRVRKGPEWDDSIT
ncbi:hypothetical protein BCR39DRAFT_507370 [Naematelia encephala]|uniref:Uncharacterized protein n=1 Tax=Naematelia encephala TaxID=71784 RepID=A0A1Y2AQB4_9TREE|nr:hypothetical protein BCR39DRAFT_507370 [Naematelia encephala]